MATALTINSHTHTYSPSSPSHPSDLSERQYHLDHSAADLDSFDEMSPTTVSSPPQPQPTTSLHTSRIDGIDHIDATEYPENPYKCQHRCDHSDLPANPLATLSSSRSTSHSSHLNEQQQQLLPDSLSMHDDLQNDNSAISSPSAPTRQRSGFADVSSLVQQKLTNRERARSLSRARSDGGLLPDELSLEDDNATSGIDTSGIDLSLSMTEAPRRQKSGYEIIKEKLRRFTTGGSGHSSANTSATNSDDDGYGSSSLSQSSTPRERDREEKPRIRCDKCLKGKPCAVHKSTEKKKALMKTKKQGAFRRLPGFE